MSEHFKLRLVRSYMLAPSVRHMAFERTDGRILSFVPGQFVQIHFMHEDRPVKRSYSVATVSGDPANPAQQVEMAVSYVEGGAATQALSPMQVGDEIDASGPYGRFCLHDNDNNQRYLLIATGTGVTPYRAMLPQLEKIMLERSMKVALLLGARTPEDLLYGEEFFEFAARVPGFRFFPCFSRSGRTEPRADDRQGYVQNLLAELKPNPIDDIAYLCGNPNMVDACFEALKAAGLPIPHIRREKYISPGQPKAHVVPA
jgi:ferredoxin-NADP reductase